MVVVRRLWAVAVTCAAVAFRAAGDVHPEQGLESQVQVETEASGAVDGAFAIADARAHPSTATATATAAAGSSVGGGRGGVLDPRYRTFFVITEPKPGAVYRPGSSLMIKVEFAAVRTGGHPDAGVNATAGGGDGGGRLEG